MSRAGHSSPIAPWICYAKKERDGKLCLVLNAYNEIHCKCGAAKPFAKVAEEVKASDGSSEKSIWCHTKWHDLSTFTLYRTDESKTSPLDESQISPLGQFIVSLATAPMFKGATPRYRTAINHYGKQVREWIDSLENCPRKDLAARAEKEFPEWEARRRIRGSPGGVPALSDAMPPPAVVAQVTESIHGALSEWSQLPEGQYPE